MKKRDAALLCILLAFALSACGSSGGQEKEPESSPAATAARETVPEEELAEESPEDDLTEDVVLESLEDDDTDWETIDWEEESGWEGESDWADESLFADAEDAYQEAEPIEVADYDPFEYVTLGEYTGLDVDMLVSTVSDEDLDAEIESILDDDSEEAEVTDGAKEDDIIAFTYTLNCEGQELESSEGEELEITLGYTEFGEEVDKALMGAKAGDTVTAEIELDDSYEDGLAGKKATYTMEVSRVYTYETPELTDDYVKEHTDFDTVEAYKEDLRASLQAENENMNRYDAGEMALSLAAKNATFKGYPQDLYDSVLAGIQEQYMYFFGEDYTSMIDEEELQEGVLEEVNSQIVLKALIQKEGLTMTEEQYQDYLKDNLSSFGESFETPEELAEVGGDSLRESAQRELVTYWLLDRDNVNELTADEYDEKYNLDFLPEDETDDDLAFELETDEAEEPAEAELPAEDLDE